jgi:ribonuclease BN (tRNA processing enzyme)
VQLTILGCSGSLPGPNAACSGYLLEADGFALVVDFGNGVLAALQEIRDPFGIDALLLSHLHPDHCADVSALTVLRRYHPAPPQERRERRLPVYAPAEAATRLAAAYAPSEQERLETDLGDVFDFHALRPGIVRIGPFEVTSAHVVHPCEAFGFRITHAGHTLVYTGDSGACPALDTLARDADVLLAEASWTHADDRPTDLHLSGREAGELAQRGGVGRLLVTHVPPWTDRTAVLGEAKAAFDGDVALAERGTSYRIG